MRQTTVVAYMCLNICQESSRYIGDPQRGRGEIRRNAQRSLHFYWETLHVSCL